MTDLPKIDASMIRQLAALNGFDLSLERAEILIPALQEILTIDAHIAQLLFDPLTIMGLSLRQEEDDKQA